MSTEVGRKAEQAAAQYAQRLGYKVLEQNWRTRWCEIDIVAQKSGIFYFVEVKYRGTSFQGSGLEYITPRKLAQMHFAAEFWMATHSCTAEYRLAACEVSGLSYEVTAWLDDIS